ncbi:MAG: hypothetical protein J6Q22_10990 [Prevotella sp.]|nr:hypothetical protein [Prevotella sp.]
MSRRDNSSEWRLRMCGLGKTADIEKAKRLTEDFGCAHGDFSREEDAKPRYGE